MYKKIIVGLSIASTLIVHGSSGHFQNMSLTYPKTSNVSVSSSSVPQNRNILDDLNLAISKIPGKIKNIFYGQKNTILILTDTLYLYNFETSKTIEQKDIPHFNTAEIKPIQNGYAVLGMTAGTQEEGLSSASSEPNEYICIIFDSNLQKVKTISISKLCGKDFVTELSTINISSDGKHLTFSTLQGLYLYEIASSKKTKLIDLTNTSNNKGLSTFEYLAFVDNNQKIAFKAQSLNIPPINNKPSFATYGTVNIDGTGLMNKKNKGYSVGELQPFNQFIMLPENFVAATGRLLMLNVATEKETIHTLSQKKEGTDGVYGSDNGKYFATASLKKNELIVRIYETTTGQLLNEKKITDTNPLYFYRVPNIRIIENSKTCIALLGGRQTDIDTKIVSFSFEK